MKLLVANWKLNPDTEREAEALARAEDAKGVVICPPFPFLEEVGEELKKAALGAQDVFWESSGAYTGEVSPSQLKDIGVEYVIVGHSERRALGETDEMVNKKVCAGLSHGFKVILCVGEPAVVRKKGIKAAQKFIAGQLKAGLRQAQAIMKKGKGELLVTYEPFWTISTATSKQSKDNADTPENAAAMAAFIKKTLVAKPYTLNPKVLYGGSVTEKNVVAFFKQKEIDGALVGGASLRPEEFKKMIALSTRIQK